MKGLQNSVLNNPVVFLRKENQSLFKNTTGA